MRRAGNLATRCWQQRFALSMFVTFGVRRSTFLPQAFASPPTGYKATLLWGKELNAKTFHNERGWMPGGEAVEARISCRCAPGVCAVCSIAPTSRSCSFDFGLGLESGEASNNSYRHIARQACMLSLADSPSKTTGLSVCISRHRAEGEEAPTPASTFNGCNQMARDGTLPPFSRPPNAPELSKTEPRLFLPLPVSQRHRYG